MIIPRATTWKLRTRTIEFTPLPLLMGIVNITPDSFSDGGLFLEADRAIEHGLRLVEEGAGILDIGGESTRPGAAPVESLEELRRVAKVLEALCSRAKVPVSIDTTKALVAREAIAAGAEIVNDVSGLTHDPAMRELAVASGVGVCVMHRRGNPQTMQRDPQYADVCREVRDYLAERKQAWLAAGGEVSRLCVDPGIGFGKTKAHNLALLRGIEDFHELDTPLLVGHSRKRFLAREEGDRELDRVYSTVGVSLRLALGGVQVLRVHDVAAHRDALVAFAASGGDLEGS